MTNPILVIKIDASVAGLSLIDFLGAHNDYFQSRKSAKKAIESGLVHINRSRAKTNYLLKVKDVLEVFPEEEKKRPKIDIAFEILYEDSFLAVVNKPAGLQVSGNRKMTLENALGLKLQASTEKDALAYPDPIHRLDFQTTGIVLIGKTVSAVRLLNKMFENRQIEKQYTAVCIGEMPDAGKIERAIDGKAAITEFTVIRRKASHKFKFLNLVSIRIETGRRHQIRKHLFSIGYPILGDPDYGIMGLMARGRGMFLHASSIKFLHPFTQETLEIKCRLPNKFGKVFK